jgi:thioredoxin 1
MESVKNLQDYANLISQGKPILLDFYANWCGPCQWLLPTVEKLAKEYEGKIEILKVNVDQNGELAEQFEVRSIPALFFIKDSQIVDKVKGVVSENVLREKLNLLIG